MQLMIQLELKRKVELGKSSRFTYHGFAVEADKIERFKKKIGKTSYSGAMTPGMATAECWQTVAKLHF